jgi:DNA replication licensing factor MCM5
MDRQSVFSSRLYPPSFGENEDTNLQVRTLLESFILDFRLDNIFIYRDQLRENALLKKYYCDINIGDLIKFNEEVAHRLVTEPAEIIPLFEAALKRCTHRIVFPHDPKAHIPEHQLLLHSNAEDVSIRDLDSLAISRLVRVPGIVIGASVMSSKATELHIQCRNCGHSQDVHISGGFSGVTLPRQCGRRRAPEDPTERFPMDPYFVSISSSSKKHQIRCLSESSPDTS